MFPPKPLKDALFPTYEGPRIARYFGEHWSMHLPFAFDLIRELQPRTYVELGVWKGESYFAVCQAVLEHGLATKCFGIDTWKGDKHMGNFSHLLGDEVADYNDRYAHFSTLKRSTFNAAVRDFEDGSIDLLHIDGAHTYEDVRRDFETWLPKVSDRGIILFHDTAVRNEDFGVWRLWEEISQPGRSFEFVFGHGLGVWKKTPASPDDSPWLQGLFLRNQGGPDAINIYYAMAAQSLPLLNAGENLRRDAENLVREAQERERQIEILVAERLALAYENIRLEHVIASAERWHESWFNRAFHRWHSSEKATRKAGFFRRWERSLRKRRKQLISYLYGKPSAEDESADKNVHPNVGLAPAVSPESTISQKADDLPADTITSDASLAREGRKKYFQHVSTQAARHPAEYVDFITYEEIRTSLRLIAFYLPQFHPIPENDRWWGRGFTEWTNVAKANPQFMDHYQPHFPGELGFYDLRLIDIQKRQMEMAKNYGLSGFCYYYYWFGGRRLLEAPLQQVLDHPELDFPFCICWANENWTRRWDGSENEILVEQVHCQENDETFIRDIAPILRDSRYIRVRGRPLLIVYRVDLLPDPAATVKRWKAYCAQNGIEEPLLVAAKTFGIADPRQYGFDAAVEFPPHQLNVRCINDDLDMINDGYSGQVHDYKEVVEASKVFKWPEYKLFRTVMPSWDNEPRKPGRGRTFAFSTPEQYLQWLTAVIEQTIENNEPEARLIFINAWNEWGEGAHLEPDRKFGYAYLDSTRNAVELQSRTESQRSTNKKV